MRVLWLALGLGLMLGPGAPRAGEIVVPVRIHFSHYEPAAIVVPEGTRVRFVITNTDPIAHEFILGTVAEQARHEHGPAVDHDGLPGQASLQIGETEDVVWTFRSPGAVLYACHIPGHYAYGMVGTVRVLSTP